MPAGGCRIRLTSEVNITELCDNTQCNTTAMIGNDSIAECNHAGQLRVLPIFTIENSRHRERNCAETQSIIVPDGRATQKISPGFYIIERVVFCSTQCIDKILIRSGNSSLPNTTTPIRFHVYKRYQFVIEDRSYFIEDQTFDVTLIRYNKIMAAFEARPQGGFVCVESGDHIGFTLSEGIEVTSIFAISSVEGSHRGSPHTQCSGITSPVFDVDPFDNFDIELPLIKMQFVQGEHN